MVVYILRYHVTIKSKFSSSSVVVVVVGSSRFKAVIRLLYSQPSIIMTSICRVTPKCKLL